MLGEDKSRERKVYSRRSFNRVLENSNSSNNLLPKGQAFDVGSDNFSGVSLENKVRINLSSKSKHHVSELRRKLEAERDMVRNLMVRIESDEAPKKLVDDVGPPPRMLNSKAGDVVDRVEKEKRTPKANKFPPSESNKKSKSKGVESFPSQMWKSCGAVLERLMRNKHGWVFKKPVDAVALGLHDYFEIIKHPMDLGTVKTRLNQNWYKSPVEFAEDVRLTFRNAMTYNPKEQDVYVMAEQLLKLFEEKWAAIEAGNVRESKLAADSDVRSPKPASRKAATPLSKARPDGGKTVDRPDDAMSVDPKRKSTGSAAPSGKVHVAKKPKAKDRDKRDMTYDEKQKLSIDLQNLPSEKLENVVQIIKKRNPSVSQEDDEIEVDIDSVDTETLWELDRFVTNYKKSLRKNKRKAEIVGQLITGLDKKIKQKVTPPVVTETPKGSRKDAKRVVSPPVEVEKRQRIGNNEEASQSSSSSDSGSSSSGDSDVESSSADGSDGRRSPNN